MSNKRSAPSQYDKMQKTTLKELCRARSLKVSGNMETLVNRLKEADAMKRADMSASKRSMKSPRNKRPSSSSKFSSSKGSLDPFDRILNGSSQKSRSRNGSSTTGSSSMSSSMRSSSSLKKSGSSSKTGNGRVMSVPFSRSHSQSAKASPRPVQRKMDVFEVYRALSMLGLHQGSRCVMAGIGRGFINITTGPSHSRNDIANQVIYEGPCSCGSTQDLRVTLKQVIFIYMYIYFDCLGTVDAVI